MKRSLWLARRREPYYDSWFIHIGVLFQDALPGDSLLLATPLVSVRIGNQSWLSKHFVVAVIKLPALIHSLPISDAAKKMVCGPREWENCFQILFSRAVGSYSIAEYRQHIRPHTRTPSQSIIPLIIAVTPHAVANLLSRLHFLTLGRGNFYRAFYLEALRQCDSNLLKRCSNVTWIRRLAGKGCP